MCQLCKATASSSTARVRRLAQEHLDTHTARRSQGLNQHEGAMDFNEVSEGSFLTKAGKLRRLVGFSLAMVC